MAKCLTIKPKLKNENRVFVKKKLFFEHKYIKYTQTIPFFSCVQLKNQKSNTAAKMSIF